MTTDVFPESRRPFFVAGGTVPPGSPSYVERAADQELFEALLTGEFCYVLNSRQMGKSSLAVRTIAKLNKAGVRTAFVDLTRIGGATVSPEQWYSGLLIETGRALGLRAEAATYLRESREVGAAQRYLGFLQESVLAQIESPIVVLIDEIDAVRSLGFSTDELFAGIRQLHNARAIAPDLSRLTICLLGAALPSDLVRDPRTTPFNVGRRIELRDFTLTEALPFASQVGQKTLERVLLWTGGHPFLTQALCAELASDDRRKGDVDLLVRERYLDARARETDTNLADVGRRLLGEGDPAVSDEARATALSLYERMLRLKPVADDESNPSAARIKMSGVARVEDGLLKPRNRIYAEAFGREWLRENTPGQELRRQRTAFRRGVLRTSGISIAIIAIVSTLAVLAARNAQTAKRNEARARKAETLARTQRNQARYDAYVASMQTMAQKADEGDGETARRTLDSLQDDPNRGWEWDYWRGTIDGDATTLDWRGTDEPRIAASPTGEWLAVSDASSLTVYDLHGRRHVRVGLPHSGGQSYTVEAFRSGDRFLVQSRTTRLALVIDARNGRVLRRRRLKGYVSSGTDNEWSSVHDRTALTCLPSTLRTYRLSLDTLEETPLPQLPLVYGVAFSSAGDRVALQEFDGETRSGLSVRRASDLRVVWSKDAIYPFVAFDPKGANLAIADGGTLKRVDAETGQVLDSTPLAGNLRGIRYSPDGRLILVKRYGGKVQEFSVSEHLRPTRAFFDVRATYVKGNRLLTSGNAIHLRDLGEHARSTAITLPTGELAFAARYGNRVVLVGAKKRIDLSKDAPLRHRTRKRLPGNAMLDLTGRYVVLYEKGTSALVDDLTGERISLRLPVPDMPLWGSPAANPRGDLLAFSLDTTHITVYDVRLGRPIKTLAGTSGATVPRFSDDGRWLAVGDEAGNVKVWDTGTWRQIASARIGRNLVQNLSFSPDGRWVAAGTSIGDLGCLDLKSGAARRFEGISQSIGDVAWSPDGKRIASGGSDREVRLWDTSTGRDLGVVGRHNAEVKTLWFTHDGTTLCSVDIGGTLKLWTAEASR